MGDQRLLYVPKRAAVHGHLPEFHVGRLRLRCQPLRARPSTPDAAQLHAMVESPCVCTATGGHRRRAVEHRPARRPAPAGTRTAFHQSGFVDPEEFQIHGIDGICSSAPKPSTPPTRRPSRSRESELHRLRCRHFLHSWQPNEFQQHFGHEEQQPEQWRAHAAARAQDDLLRHRASQTCLSTIPHPAQITAPDAGLFCKARGRIQARL